MEQALIPWPQTLFSRWRNATTGDIRHASADRPPLAHRLGGTLRPVMSTWCQWLLGLLLGASSVAATAAPATLVQAFGSSQWASFNFTDPLTLRHVHPGRADRVTAEGNRVWWQQGQDIYTARTDGSDARLYLHTSVAANDLAVDVDAGRFYVSLPGIGVRALDIDRPDQVMGFLTGDYLRVAAGGGHVFAATAQGSIAVSDASFAQLDGVITSLGESLKDIAYDESIDALYAIFQASNPNLGLVSAVAQFRGNASEPAGYQRPSRVAALADSFTTIAAAAGTVVWNSNDGLWVVPSSWFFGDLRTLPSNRLEPNFGLSPVDLALVAAPPSTPVPEPGTALLLLGAACVQQALWRRRRDSPHRRAYFGAAARRAGKAAARRTSGDERP